MIWAIKQGQIGLIFQYHIDTKDYRKKTECCKEDIISSDIYKWTWHPGSWQGHVTSHLVASNRPQQKTRKHKKVNNKFTFTLPEKLFEANIQGQAKVA